MTIDRLPASTSIAPSEPPLLNGLPFWGNASEMARDPLQLFVRGYKSLGPVYRVKAAGRTFHVIAGPTAHEFIAAGGDAQLTTGPTLGATAGEIGAQRSLMTVEGAEHTHMRKAQRPGYSKTAFLKGAPRAFAQSETRLAAWRTGDVIDIFPVLQRLVMEQLALALIGEKANDYFDDVRTYISTILNVRVHGLWPELALHTPGYRRAKARFVELGTTILNKRRAEADSERADLISDALGYTDLEDRPLNDKELVMAVTSPFIAGMDTAASMASFLLYELLSHPDVLAQVKREVDAHLNLGNITPEMFTSMPALHGAAMESLRMHTIAIAQPRIATSDFAVNGFAIRKGSYVMIAGAVSHYLPEFFKDPYTFSPERFLAPRFEHRKKHAYAPYGIGAHTCLGAGVAELQFPLNIALLVQRFDLALHPADYRLSLSNNPTPHPKGFKVRVVAKR